MKRYKQYNWPGRSLGLVVTGGNSCSKGREFESQHHILDEHFSHTYLFEKIVMFVSKDENKWKEAGVGPFFKTIWSAGGRHTELSGFVCAYHLTFPGSNPKRTISISSIDIVKFCTIFVIVLRKDENKQKGGRVWPIFKQSDWLLENFHAIRVLRGSRLDLLVILKLFYIYTNWSQNCLPNGLS